MGLAKLIGIRLLSPGFATEHKAWQQSRSQPGAAQGSFSSTMLTSLAKARKLLLSWTLDMISVRSSYSSTSSLSSRKTPWLLQAEICSGCLGAGCFQSLFPLQSCPAAETRKKGVISPQTHHSSCSTQTASPVGPGQAGHHGGQFIRAESTWEPLPPNPGEKDQSEAGRRSTAQLSCARQG